MPSESRMRQLLAEMLGRFIPSNVGIVDNAAIGRTFYVNNAASNEGDTLGGGTGWHNPLASIGYALSQCVANRGDVIYVGPGHAETITGAAGANAATAITAVAGVRIIGVGTGRKRPTLTWSATDSQIICGGANMTWENFVFNVAGIDAVVAAFSVTGADVSFLDCEFIISTSAIACVLVILSAATAARLVVKRCKFLGVMTTTGGTAGAGNTACIKHEVGIDFEISDNWFQGKMTQAILNATTIIGGLIARNMIHVGTGTAAITMAAGSTAMIAENRMVVASGTDPAGATACSFTGNRYTTAGNGPTGGTADAI